ncbi:hypothetical protein EBR96_09370 [bacterium]|nr:hypothetical protein [bacterium]
MIRRDLQTNEEKVYYFINNAQGTPVYIIDSANNVVSRISMDEFGNLAKTHLGSINEINYTGKKLDPETGFYYFNQRYYDPVIGRFLSEDPAGQAFNPYLYAGNNPLAYVDADGEFFTELFSAICPGLGTLLGAMLDGAAISAATNAAVQLATSGQVNWNAVGQSAMGGAIGAGVFNVVGGVSGMFGFAQGGLEKIAMHGVAGGICSSLQGVDFWSGAIGAGVSQALSPGIMGSTTDPLGRIAGASLVGGVAAWATGGSFYHGALGGGFGMAFNELSHPQTMRQMARKLLKDDHGTTPEKLPGELAKGGYNLVNKAANSEYTFIAAKAYLVVAPFVPSMWAGIPYAAGYVSYSEAMVPGGAWPEWR